MWGLKIVTNHNLVRKELKRMCRSKKKRVRKKWLRNPGNYRTFPDPNVYQTGNLLICHPQVAVAIKEQVCKSIPERTCYNSGNIMSYWGSF